MPLDGEYVPSPEKWVRDQVERYESSGGTKGTTLGGRPVIVLTTLGAKSGKIRKAPLMRVEHDGRYVAVASLEEPGLVRECHGASARRGAGRPGATRHDRP